MSAHLSWHPAGVVLVSCHVYPGGAPILSASDGAGFALNISSGDRASVSAGHAGFAREFAEAVARYAVECARWVAGPVSEPEQEDRPQSAA